MKNYRWLVPILLIAFTYLAIDSRITELKAKENQYHTYLEAAREYRDGKIYSDAWEQYNLALGMNHTLELCKEIAEFRKEQNDERKIKEWGDYIVSNFPKEVYGYEYLIDHFYAQGKYKECFSVYETVEKRKLFSESLAEKMNSLKYEYKVGNGRYRDVSEYVGDYCVYYGDSLYGYCSERGEPCRAEKYLWAGPFNEERAAIQDEYGEYYFIDIDGNRRINVPKDIEVTKVGCLSENVFAVGTQGKMYYANIKGELVLGPYEDATTFNYQRAAIKENGKWYLIDSEGNKLTDGYLSFVTDEKQAIYRNDVIFAQTEEGYVCLDGQGKKITDQVYEDARMFLDNTLAAVKLNGLWGYIDYTGTMQIEPQYEDAKSFRNDVAAVKQDGLWGYIDSDGVMIIPTMFLDAKSFNTSGYTFVMQDDESEKWSVLELIRDTYIY